MALNKKMHPRNIYKNPPSFKKLAIDDEEFRQHAKMDISGKVSLDFKDPAALRALTRALLKKDWGLDVHIPPDNLVPTLPLRLNYILWLEDLLCGAEIASSPTSINGIDIGTGATCIYPLLAAKKNGWHMLGTEENDDCATFAVENVQRNGLNLLVSVKKVSGNSVLLEAVSSTDIIYDFCMCNPPFFANEQELEAADKSRSLSRPRVPPRNARTGSSHEVIVPGGEVAFVQKMIEESLLMKDRVRVFTTMLGRKSSVEPVIRSLKKVGVESVARMEFCQGHTTRWGVGWSHSKELSKSTTPIPKKEKPKPPLTYTIPCSEACNFGDVSMEVKKLMDHLQMHHKVVENSPSSIIFHVIAQSNTWSNQRRKRREQKIIVHSQADSNPVSDQELMSAPDEQAASSISVTQDRFKRPSTSEEVPECKRAKLSVGSEGHPFVVWNLVVHQSDLNNCGHIVLEMNWLDGTGGRDAVHQIMQYFKNNLKLVTIASK